MKRYMERSPPTSLTIRQLANPRQRLCIPYEIETVYFIFNYQHELSMPDFFCPTCGNQLKFENAEI